MKWQFLQIFPGHLNDEFFQEQYFEQSTFLIKEL